MRLLAVETATEACSCALWDEGRVLERFEQVGRGHTQRLPPMVLELLASAGVGFSQLDGLVCGIGPGSFAGVRIALGFIQGLALARELPVQGVSTLATLAQGSGQARVVAALDARMGEIYLGCYQRDATGLVQALGPERVCAPGQASLPAGLDDDWHAVGSGWGAYPELLETRLGRPQSLTPEALPHAAQALELALPAFRSGQTQDLRSLQPAYLRNKVALNLIEQKLSNKNK
jgi:tRNA threonylcarbamoyladenosine biosynthesis protein TsaB